MWYKICGESCGKGTVEIDEHGRLLLELCSNIHK